MISGSTTLIAHIGYPTETFKAPLIYNPYLEKAGIDAVVVPMGVKAVDYPDFLKSIFRLTNCGNCSSLAHWLIPRGQRPYAPILTDTFSGFSYKLPDAPQPFDP
jgi:hypothetical protein